MSSFGSALHEFLPRLIEQANFDISRSACVVVPSFENLIAALIDAKAGNVQVQPVLKVLSNLDANQPEPLAVLELSEFTEAWPARSKKQMATLAVILKRFAASVVAMGGVERVQEMSAEAVKEAWIQISGLGLATVDQLLCVVGHPVLPIDRATYRILVRHGWISEDAGYEEAQDVILSAAPEDQATLAVLGDAFSKIGKRWCKASLANCLGCPLAPWLPDGGKPYGKSLDD